MVTHSIAAPPCTRSEAIPSSIAAVVCVELLGLMTRMRAMELTLDGD